VKETDRRVRTTRMMMNAMMRSSTPPPPTPAITATVSHSTVFSVAAVVVSATDAAAGKHNKISDRSFSTAGPRLWNNLPPGLRRPGLFFDSFRQSLATEAPSDSFDL